MGLKNRKRNNLLNNYKCQGIKHPGFQFINGGARTSNGMSCRVLIFEIKPTFIMDNQRLPMDNSCI